MLSHEIRYIKGVGPKKGELFNRMGINRVVDMLFFAPRDYEDRRQLTLVKHLTEKLPYVVRVRVDMFGLKRVRGSRTIFHLTGRDDTGILHCLWFNQPYLKEVFKVGDEVIFFGKVDRIDKDEAHMIHPEYELINRKEDLIHSGRIIPIYPLTGNLTQKYMRKLFYQILDKKEIFLTDMFNAKMREKIGISEINDAIRNMHFPKDFNNLKEARQRVIFSEFFLLQLAILFKKQYEKLRQDGVKQITNKSFICKFEEALPFQLTKGQKRAIEEIRKDMSQSKPMSRLLEGDVGSGKTVIACYALLAASHNSYQAAFLAPTEILAEQQFIKLSEFLVSFDVKIELLVSALSKQKKDDIKKRLANHEIDIIVGTHALLQDDVNFKKLGLAVIDEQHKFGVKQRETLKRKGKNPDILIMSATPIPRTLALTVYGELDITQIGDKPKERGDVYTYLLSREDRYYAIEFIKGKVKEGLQGYIVCPFIENDKSGENETASVESVSKDLIKNHGDDVTFGIVHGKMNVIERNEVLDQFKKKKIDVLVSTVMVEVGIDIPNATCMIVENADRFGLAQLHQMRGRIHRSKKDAYCFLISYSQNIDTENRLDILTKNNDGYEIASNDLTLRGSGQFFGSKQHGAGDLRFGDIIKDIDIMDKAKEEARKIIEDDASLTKDKNRLIRKSLFNRFKGKLKLIEV